MKDYLGIGLAGLCVVHCLWWPVSLLAVTTLGPLADGELFHMALLVPVCLVAWLSLGRSYRCHGKRGPGLLAMSGILLMFTALVAGERWELVLTLAGSALLATGHGWHQVWLSKCRRQLLSTGEA